MSENDDLAMCGFSNQAFSYSPPVHVVERRNGIVKDDAGLIFRGGEFSHERGQSNAAIFTFAQDLPHCGSGFPRKCDLEAGDALNSVLLAKLHGKASNLKTRHLTSELRAKCLSH